MSLRRELLSKSGKVIDDNILYTKTSYLIMPMIGYMPDNFIGIDGKNHLINSYLDLSNNYIKIVIDNTDDPKILKLLEFNLNNFYYHGFTADDDENEIVLSFAIPDHYKEDLNIFLTSKYSKLSDTYKRRLIGLYGKHTNPDNHKPTIFEILYPMPYKRAKWAKYLGVDTEDIDEVSPALDMDYESYKTIEELTTNKETTNTEQIKYE